MGVADFQRREEEIILEKLIFFYKLKEGKTSQQYTCKNSYTKIEDDNIPVFDRFKLHSFGYYDLRFLYVFDLRTIIPFTHSNQIENEQIWHFANNSNTQHKYNIPIVLPLEKIEQGYHQHETYRKAIIIVYFKVPFYSILPTFYESYISNLRSINSKKQPIFYFETIRGWPSNFVQLLIKIIILMIASNRQGQQSTDLLLAGRLAEGYEWIKQRIDQQPQQSHHFITKALYEFRMGNTKNALTQLNKSISLDYLNHHAYFNLFSIQMGQGERQSAFKNLCCCLSVAHLLKAQKEESVEEVEKAIEYCFNNKEARMLKSIFKLQAKKNIEALNQINYALYLAPSHQSLKVVQEKVYKIMGMKELKGKNTPFQKPKYDRLETNMEIPPADKIKGEIEKLLKDYNSIIRSLDNSHLYKATFLGNKTQTKSLTQKIEQKQKKPSQQIKFHLVQSLQKHANELLQKQMNEPFQACNSMKDRQEKQSTTNNSEHVLMVSSQDRTIDPNQRNQPFFVLDSSLSNLSISNISQNSNIKMNRVRAGMVDYNQAQPSNNILESSISSSASNGQLKLPLRRSQLKSNEKIVVTLQRTVMNERGETEQREELYEVVGKDKLELVRINK